MFVVISKIQTLPHGSTISYVLWFNNEYISTSTSIDCALGIDCTKKGVQLKLHQVQFEVQNLIIIGIHSMTVLLLIYINTYIYIDIYTVKVRKHKGKTSYIIK